MLPWLDYEVLAGAVKVMGFKRFATETGLYSIMHRANKKDREEGFFMHETVVYYSKEDDKSTVVDLIVNRFVKCENCGLETIFYKHYMNRKKIECYISPELGEDKINHLFRDKETNPENLRIYLVTCPNCGEWVSVTVLDLDDPEQIGYEFDIKDNANLIHMDEVKKLVPSSIREYYLDGRPV